MQKALIKLESTETGYSMDTCGNIFTIALMIGNAISEIEDKLPSPVRALFREALAESYKRGCEKNGENESTAGDS